MAGQNDRAKQTRPTAPGRPAKRDAANVAGVLKTIYEDAAREEIPKEMLDLLSRLD